MSAYADVVEDEIGGWGVYAYVLLYSIKARSSIGVDLR